ncbi:hypothetical protein HMPREF1584_01221 [Gardnerella vaginalis JCP8481A]|uniref:Uncharacterized protein n=1 Tax=Gardnerella vaginalis TaxID=2702 RepID=A0A133NSH4_GARVA|nr:hypothetical protein HMPREF1584_01221 [Gardnerella vaginalis JCP8481A]EPI42218.1 hypothetical protein HMPREF1585_01019 [Gardnerella vaginalis JCP8481B]KXA19244.1 hypothetical protein HMPREF3208_01128 [Gardnerella vaginalis]
MLCLWYSGGVRQVAITSSKRVIVDLLFEEMRNNGLVIWPT